MASLQDIKQKVSNFDSYVELKLIPYLQEEVVNFTAGYIKQNIERWKDLTSDREVLSTVMGLKIEFKSVPIQNQLHTTRLAANEMSIIDLEIQNLISKNVIEPTGRTTGDIISGIFLRDKKDGGHRLILNLKSLNEFTTKHHFKMDTLNTISKLVEKDCYMASIDLKDAYYSVPIAYYDRRYLKFTWRGRSYQFTCLPNGLSSGPRKFTKLLKPVLSKLHEQGHISCSYIDDLYLQGKTYDKCLHNVIDTITEFSSLGFRIHPTKSIFKPKQEIVILGFVINSVSMTISLTPEKAVGIKLVCESLLACSFPTIREVARVIGKIIAACPGNMYGLLHYRCLEKDKTIALKHNKGNFDKKMTLSAKAKAELKWWIDNIMTINNTLCRGPP